MSRKTAIYGLVVLQSLALAALVGWWLYQRAEAGGDGGFGRLMDRVRDEGAPAGARALGRDVVRAGVEACHFDACIAALFNGDVEHHRRATQDTRTDRCAGYTQAECTPERARRGIEEVLVQAATFLTCEGGALRKGVGGRAVVDVRCIDRGDPTHVVADRVHLKADATGGYLVEGVPRFPGFLPEVYADLRRAPPGEADPPEEEP